MSGTVTVDPTIRSLSPMGFGEITVPVGIDFAALIPAGYAIDPASVVAGVMTSIPAGFTFSNIGLSGTMIVFQTQAPTTAGSYLLQAAPRLTGASPEPLLPRSVSVLVMQR